MFDDLQACPGTPGAPARGATPAHGLHRDGSLARDLGGYQAVLAIEDPATVRLTFTGADGRPLRTVPAALRAPFATEIRELKALVKEVGATLAAECARLEELLADGSARPFAPWSRAFLDHPVTGVVARSLIWEFEDRDGVRHTATPGDGVLVTVDGRALPVPPHGAPVRLWHPAAARPGAVRAWRGFVVDNRMRQAFRQAFREVYVPTAAERGAAAPSRRFAGRTADRERLLALFEERGWHSPPPSTPTHAHGTPGGGLLQGEMRRVFAGGVWRACFEYAARGGDRQVTAGAVRFQRRDGRWWRDVPPADVPPLVFSEAMRDVDLVTDAASEEAHSEPSGGPERPGPGGLSGGAERPGLGGLSGGEERPGPGALSASAEVRRDALALVLPRTRIADRCVVEDRFLRVRGDHRVYWIHLGTGAVLMESGGVLAHTVPARRFGRAGLFLPFEDERLTLILSTAFLLAADRRITDAAVLRQIRGRP
ncbi:DUF4132 domain-containing protein [Actinomadura fibrosa]|uniref:DUF4132 domain-containing protein n=1 Tax=Actinomadura fibrosa TaxID=111802 RepID=A0ABW2XZ88_9ACTN|nr:DUF4132 domain-containing protein [Actinomadura fibrosa]